MTMTTLAHATPTRLLDVFPRTLTDASPYQFLEFLPDPSPQPRRKASFLLAHLVRLFAGQELDFDVQLVLRRDEVPPCRLRAGNPAGADEVGSRLGWNTWLTSKPLEREAVTAGVEAEMLDNAAERIESRFGDFAVLGATAEGFETQQRVGSGGVTGGRG